MSKKLSKSEVEKIAELARIELTEKEIEKFQTEISNILDFIEQIQEVDLDKSKGGVSHVADFAGKTTRVDEVGTSLDKEDVFKNADQGRSKGDYFVTSKIL